MQLLIPSFNVLNNSKEALMNATHNSVSVQILNLVKPKVNTVVVPTCEKWQVAYESCIKTPAGIKLMNLIQKFQYTLNF